jgi:hypothetical protein
MTDHTDPGAMPGFLPLADDVDTTERLSADDMATRREAEFLGAALRKARQQHQAPVATGRCAWCGERCEPPALHCDAECRADHERQQDVLRRQGRAAGR